MLLIEWPNHSATTWTPWSMFILTVLAVVSWTTGVASMTDDEVVVLRRDTKDLFYHGFHNYMTHAFPEDELKPISCEPQTRNRHDPADIGLNDVLGNYSLTLIDSLSTLAILASGENGKKDERKPLRDFQNGVKSLVELYGDGTPNKPCGKRACAFDLDSKVQVFETNIRGVGGLISAHLFAIGELPIKGYDPVWKSGKNAGIRWKNGFVYNDQLLHLAQDLATRLLPAFGTPTHIPYPRVNLRSGIPFYQDAEQGVCRLDGTSTDPREITENCAAGAGSLVLEFSALSRMTGDMRFERLAKKAFWAVWQRRSQVGLIGNGIDAETGQWTMPALSGIGAGIDSFFEYSIKSHILLSGLPYNTSSDEMDSPDDFLQVWQQAHAAVKRHVYRTPPQERHPFYSQVDFFTGASRYGWIDNLSAYYPGLLVLAGELNEAIESHLVYAALWTKYGALPERWHAANSYIEPNFKHWAGRPEFIESTFHLYQATKDPYYLHVGEMAIRDIRRRCWTNCGWADLGDVKTGEQRDRMESFFLGETAKYLYLLFDENHPLNRLDRPVVFTTEGHPLIIPDTYRIGLKKCSERRSQQVERVEVAQPGTCAAPLRPLSLTVSNIANRGDLYHAAYLAQLHTEPVDPARASPSSKTLTDDTGIVSDAVRSPSNYTFYPWTLPSDLLPSRGISLPLVTAITSTLTFPNFGVASTDTENGAPPLGALQKIFDGVVVNSLSNMRIEMIQEPKHPLIETSSSETKPLSTDPAFRIHGIANWALGRDEKVLLTDKALQGVSPSDPNFTRIKDLEMVDILVDVPVTPGDQDGKISEHIAQSQNGTLDNLWTEINVLLTNLLANGQSVRQDLIEGFTANPVAQPDAQLLNRRSIPAILPVGPGMAPLPAVMDNNPLPLSTGLGHLPYSSIFYLSDPLCDHRLPVAIAKTHNILIVHRGDCSFSHKLANIPSYAPSPTALQLVIIISISGHNDDRSSIPSKNDGLIRPLLDQPQMTPNGFERRHPIAMVMVDGTVQTIVDLQQVASALGSFDDNGKFVEARKESTDAEQGIKIGSSRGLGLKRRYWFESMGVPIANLLML